MSVMQTVMQTAAQFLPGKKADPLIDHVRFVGKPLQRVDAAAKVKGEARFTAEFNLADLVYGGARSQHHCQR